VIRQNCELRGLIKYLNSINIDTSMAFKFMKNKQSDIVVKKDKDEYFVEAKEVEVCPADESVKITLYEAGLKKILVGRVVNAGDIITVEKEKKSKNQNSSSNPFFDDVFNSVFDESFGLNGIKLKILITQPKGAVKITNDTKLMFKSEKPNEDGIPESKIIHIKRIPDLKKYYELRDSREILKLINLGKFVSRFDDSTRTVYLIDGYYYEKKRSKKG